MIWGLLFVVGIHMCASFCFPPVQFVFYKQLHKKSIALRITSPALSLFLPVTPLQHELSAQTHYSYEAVRDQIREVHLEVANLQKLVFDHGALIEKINFVTEFNRVRLLLTELCDEYQQDIAPQLLSAKVNSNDSTRFIRAGDSSVIKLVKTKYALEKLSNLDKSISKKLAKKYGPELLSSVLDCLHSLNLDTVQVDEKTRQHADDWWAGLDG